jgi:hypothetical protein
MVASCLLLFHPPISAQTVKEFVADACYNEIQQRNQNLLWASQVQRRTDGHIYLEKQIETVGGPVHRLLSVDGHEPSPSERKQEDDQLRNLMHNSKAQVAMKKSREAEGKKLADLLRLMPEVFLFEDEGSQGGQKRLGFRPDPAYSPKSYEETALHALRGYILVDVHEKRLVELSGTLTQQVDFGHGLIASLKKGGTIDVRRNRLAPGIWKTSSIKLDVDGRVALFKTISKQQDETQSDFKPVAPGTSIEQGLATLVGN